MGRAGSSGSTLSVSQALGQCLSPSWSAGPLVVCSWSVQQARFVSGSLPAWSGLSRLPWQTSLLLAPAWGETSQGLTQAALSLAGCSVTPAIRPVWQAPLLSLSGFTTLSEPSELASKASLCLATQPCQIAVATCQHGDVSKVASS